MRYYLKKCGSQELGSVTDGRTHRGRYLFTSMNDDVLEMFPPLSSAIINDCNILPIIPLYSGKKVYCNYIYHNSKLVNGQPNGRNEYRIYLNRELEGDRLLFQEGNIVVIRSEVVEVDDGSQTIYYLDLLQNPEMALYRELNSVIETSEISGGYGIKDGVIAEFEDKVARVKQADNREVAVDESVTRRIEENVDAVAGLFNSVSFRDFVMVGYESLCAVTGTVIRYDAYMNLEAAHIRPKSHKGLFMPNNGIALCRDLHWAFDKGFFTLSNDCKVVVHPQTTSDWLRAFDGRPIRMPKDQFFRPAPDNIQYHAENVYGLFLTSGRL
jgi:hypothetical protein